MLVDMTLTLKKIPGIISNDYRAGSDGRIYSRKKYFGFGRTETVPWYALKGSLGVKGYQLISISHKNKRQTKSVHRLVCLAFHGPCPKGCEVRHLDGNPKNNVPSNLRWGTQIEQWQDRVAHGRVAFGEKHHAAKLTDAEREHLRWAIKNGLCSQRQAARVLGVAQSSVAEIVSG